MLVYDDNDDNNDDSDDANDDDNADNDDDNNDENDDFEAHLCLGIVPRRILSRCRQNFSLQEPRLVRYDADVDHHNYYDDPYKNLDWIP